MLLLTEHPPFIFPGHTWAFRENENNKTQGAVESDRVTLFRFESADGHWRAVQGGQHRNIDDASAARACRCAPGGAAPEADEEGSVKAEVVDLGGNGRLRYGKGRVYRGNCMNISSTNFLCPHWPRIVMPGLELSHTRVFCFSNSLKCTVNVP